MALYGIEPLSTEVHVSYSHVEIPLSSNAVSVSVCLQVVDFARSPTDCFFEKQLTRIELASSRWQRDVLPLDHSCMASTVG